VNSWVDAKAVNVYCSVDYRLYPGLAEVEYYQVSLSAGDCLYVPYNWWVDCCAVSVTLASSIVIDENYYLTKVAQWCSGRALDLRSIGRGFNSYWDKAVWQPWAGCSHLCASVTKQYNLVHWLKIKCNVFLFVEVNFSLSVFNINKSIWVLRKITKITNLLKKRFKVRHRRNKNIPVWRHFWKVAYRRITN